MSKNEKPSGPRTMRVMLAPERIEEAVERAAAIAYDIESEHEAVLFNGKVLTRDDLAYLVDVARHLQRQPRVVCLSGSMRFEREMRAAAVDLSLEGSIVTGPFVNMKQPDPRWATEELAEPIKTALDELHFRKIDLADEVVVVSDAAGYIGESTKNEIAYAEQHGKPVRYLRIEASSSTDEVEDLKHVLARRTEDCDQVREALLPILQEHPLSRDDVRTGDFLRLRAGHVAKTAAELLQWYALEAEQLRRGYRAMKDQHDALIAKVREAETLTVHPAAVRDLDDLLSQNPDEALVDEIADVLWRIEGNYNREGSGPGSRFEGQRCEVAQARTVIRTMRSALAEELAEALKLPPNTDLEVLLAEVRRRFKHTVRAVVGHGYRNGYNECECGLPTPTLGDWTAHVDELRAAGVPTAVPNGDEPSA